jgi:hypothetical protein
MTPYSKFEGVHQKNVILQEIGNYCTTRKMLPISTTRKLGCWMLLLDDVYYYRDNHVHSTSLANLDEDTS